MRINNNMLAINSHRQLAGSALEGAKSMEKLASGIRINHAGDDAAGLAISEKMRAQIRGTNMASRNASDTISLIQTAEGALGETHSIMQRMRELAVQAANDTYTNSDRAELQNEIKQLKSEVDRIGNTTEFNTRTLLDGSARGVVEEVAGTFKLNANSGTVGIGSDQVQGLQKVVGESKNWALDGAFMLLKSKQTFNSAGEALFDFTDYKMVGKNGVEYDFKKADAAGTVLTADQLGKMNSIVGSGSYKIGASSGYIISGAVTIGTGTTADESKFTTLGKGSVLSVDSTFTVGTTGFKLDIGNTQVELKISGSNLLVGGEVVAAGATFILGDGTVLENGTNTGEITIKQGSVTLAADIGVGGQALKEVNLEQDSILAKGTDLKAEIELKAGSVITSKAAVDAGKSGLAASVTFANGGTSVQFSKDTDAVLATNFNDMKVTDSFTFVFSEYSAASSNLNDSIMSQIGANSGQTMFVSMGDMRSKALGISEVDVSTKMGAATAIETVNNALDKISAQRSSLGAIQNRLEYTIKNLDVAAENLQAAESRIRDVDMAKEVMTFTKNTILQQASQAMLAQANQAPQSVLQLLR